MESKFVLGQENAIKIADEAAKQNKDGSIE
jgi:hypothetical protein